MKKRKRILTSLLLTATMALPPLICPVISSAAPKVFSDVTNESDYYYTPVYWAVGKGITRGTSANTFSPDISCTRAQIVTFLWNSAGSPQVTAPTGFSDVPSGAWYAKAVSWAVSEGITNGTSDTEFSPDDPCTRAQAMTFIYKSAGSPAASRTSSFSDVASNTWYSNAVAWAVANGVTSGISPSEFAPDQVCTRGQIATFLYKYAGKNDTVELPEKSASFDLSQIPAYSGSPYIAVNGNVPYFSTWELKTDGHETYSPLDWLGRCGTADASVGPETMPTGPRGSIGMIKPTGWHTVKYNGIDGNYLYNRCHLIGYQLTAENANERNLITGTRYLNVDGMLPFENMVADYVKETGNHVEYRVSPIFIGNNLVADGVLMEAQSVEDNGAGIKFCVYVYNVQPGITINYADGSSSGPEYTGSTPTPLPAPEPQPTPQPAPTPDPEPSVTPTGGTYYWTPKGKSYHASRNCSTLRRSKTVLSGSLSDAMAAGKYDPCNICIK